MDLPPIIHAGIPAFLYLRRRKAAYPSTDGFVVGTAMSELVSYHEDTKAPGLGNYFVSLCLGGYFH